jgi:antitoxin component YwqK of YwqJK toxin-antitoxin module
MKLTKGFIGLIAMSAMTLTACKSTTKEYFEDAEGVLKKECQLGYFSDKISGTCTHYNKEGEVYLKESYKDDVLHGKVRHFENGVETVLENYKNGKLHGESKGVTLEGVVWLEANYVEGKLNGKHILRFANGNLKVEENYNEKGKDGVQKRYYENGQLAHSATYADGCLSSVDEVFSEDGRALNPGDYKNGEGFLVVYYDNGSIRSQGRIQNYKQVGDWKMYSRKGKHKNKRSFNPDEQVQCEFKYVAY